MASNYEIRKALYKQVRSKELNISIENEQLLKIIKFDEGEHLFNLTINTDKGVILINGVNGKVQKSFYNSDLKVELKKSKTGNTYYIQNHEGQNLTFRVLSVNLEVLDGVINETYFSMVNSVPGEDVNSLLNITNKSTFGTKTSNNDFSGNVTINGTTDIKDLKAVNGKFTGTLVADGGTTLGSTLKVNGSSTLAALSATTGAFSSTLGVTGATTLGSTLNVTGLTSLSTLNTTGLSTLNSLKVNGSSTLATLVATAGTFSSTLGVKGATTLESTLNVTGLTSLSTLNTTGLSSLSTLNTTGLSTLNSLKVNGSSNLAALSATTGTFSSTLGVTGATTLGSTLNVTGASTIADLSAAKGTFSGNLNADGATTLGSTLNVTGASTLAGIGATTGTFSSTLGVTGATTLGSTLNVTGASTLAGIGATTGAFSSTLGVTGATTLGSTLNVTGTTTLNDTLNVPNKKSTLHSLDVTNATVLKSTLNVTGLTSLSTLSTSGLATLESLNVTNGSVLAALSATTGTFSGTLNAKGVTTLESTLNVTGITTLNDALNVPNIKSTLHSLDVTNATNLKGTLDVKGSSTLADLTADSGTFTETLNVADDTTLSSSLTVGDKTTTKTLEITEDGIGAALLVKGNVKIDKELQVVGKSQFDDNVIIGSTTSNKKLTVSEVVGELTGNAATATKLKTKVKINGTDFDGEDAITTETWGTPRNITIGTGPGKTKSVNGSTTYNWSHTDIGINNPTITITAGTGLVTGGNFDLNQSEDKTITLNHSNSVTAGNVGSENSSTPGFGSTFNIPYIIYDDQGHIKTGTKTVTSKIPSTLATPSIIGLVGTSTQSFGGVKTFEDGVVIGTTAKKSNLTVEGDLNVKGSMNVNNVNVIETSNGIIFEGATKDEFETTLVAIDPKKDNIVSLPNDTGTVALTKELMSYSFGTGNNQGDYRVTPAKGGTNQSAGNYSVKGLSTSSSPTFKDVTLSAPTGILKTNIIRPTALTDGAIINIGFNEGDIKTTTYIHGKLIYNGDDVQIDGEVKYENVVAKTISGSGNGVDTSLKIYGSQDKTINKGKIELFSNTEIDGSLSVENGITGSLTGNADTATKLGTTTVGSSTKPIYLNAGTATASTSTVGSATTPVYLNSGTITAGTTLGTAAYEPTTSFRASNWVPAWGDVTGKPTATSSVLGIVKTGYVTSGKNYAVGINNGNLFVNVPWENTVYTHPSISRTDTTSSTSPGYSGTFTAVDSVTSNAAGHISAINLKTVTMPSAQTLPTVNNSTITIEAGSGLSTGGNFTLNQSSNKTITLNHSNSVTAGSVSEGGSARTLAFGGTFNIPSFNYDAQGHLTSKGSIQLKMPANPNVNYYPTTFAWTNGTTSGPTGSLTGPGVNVPFGAIPSASSDFSGIVNTTTQTFKGNKTFSNDVVISGDLTVKGDNFIAETTTVRTNDDVIELRSNGTKSITAPAGIVVKKYDGTNDGGIVIKDDGEVRVGKVAMDATGAVKDGANLAQPVLTRNEWGQMAAGNVLIWDGTNKRAVTSNQAKIGGVTLVYDGTSESVRFTF